MSMLFYLLQVTLCMAIFYGFYHLALRKETLFDINRLYLLTTLVLSLGLPFLRFEIAPEVIQQEILASIILVETSVTSLSENLSDSALNKFNLSSILFTFYITGMFVMTLRLLIAYKQILKIKLKSTSVTIQGKHCLLSAEVKAPFSFFNTIYLPLSHHYQETELAEVIAHESAHVQERHSWDVLLMEIVTIICWINPFIYLYRKSLSDVHEYIADKAVLQNSQWENYAQLLVRQQYKQLPNALSHQLIYSQLKNRLRMMTRRPSGAVARLKYFGIVPALLISMMLFSFTYQDAMRTAEDDQIGMDKSPMEESGVPLYPGCEKVPATDQKSCSSTKLIEYMSEHLVFPKSIREQGIKGKVVAKFTVGSDGKLKEVTIVKSLHQDADLAVLNLLEGMNDKVGKWTPATKGGKAVDAIMHLPVLFKYDEN